MGFVKLKALKRDLVAFLKVIADFSRGVFSPLSGKKVNQKNTFSYYQNCNHSTLPNRHIYYEPPEEFDWDATSSLLPELDSTGEVIVHRTPTSPESKSGDTENSRKDSGLPQSDTNISSDNSKDSSKERERAYTEEEFTSAILARTPKEVDFGDSSSDAADDSNELTDSQNMGDSGVASMVRDSLVSNCQSVVEGHEDCDCERRCSNPKHAPDCKSGDYAVSPILERRNKGVLGRLRNLASRSSYSPSEDGHSHSSDYEEPEDEKKPEPRFSRDTRERSSSSWAGRVRDLHRDVKKKISKFRNSRGTAADDELGEGAENSDIAIQPGSSVESIPSGSGSSLQPPTPTSSNRSSTSAGEDDHNTYVGTFIGRARALVDCTPSPYDRDGLTFKKGDIIDIIAKHKTGIWVGMAQGKVGHFKFINVQEIVEERRKRHRRRKISNDILNISKKPENLEELLNLLGLQEYTNVLVLNGYDELDSFKEIEKMDLDNLGITDTEHSSKLLRAAEMLQDADVDDDDELEEEDEEEEDDSPVKQSPRDSGCYASHENLIHRDTSQRALSNGQFMVDLEEDTSQSESGIHSRDGQGSTVMMNNLDVSAESSTKSTATTMDDANGSADQVECTNDLSNYNILPTLETEEVDPDPEELNALTSAVEIVVPTPEIDSNSVSIPYLLSSTGPKSSPGSPRKTRNKHSRNKSHSHRSKDLFNDLSLNCHSLGYAKYRHISADTLPDQSTYVYSWASFTRSEKNLRRNFHDYDDVVSDTATEAEDSPGRHVYRRVKQRKGSLQTLIHDNRPPSPTIMSKVNKKLVAEKVYLHEEPYTDKTGFCGIPPALVQRYAEELGHSIVDVADALDQIRITSLQQQARRGVPNDFLSDSCIVPVVEPNYSSLRSWLISLGLPMYESNFTSAGLRELHHISTLSVEDLVHLGIHDTYHQLYLESALTVLYMRFRRRPQTYVQGQSLS